MVLGEEGKLASDLCLYEVAIAKGALVHRFRSLILQRKGTSVCKFNGFLNCTLAAGFGTAFEG
jgi:hypothetical protein